MDKSQLLEHTRLAHATWEAALARLDEAQILAPGAGGTWSLKDVIAHLAWHEREMIELVRSHVLAGSEMWGWPLDERNHAIYLANCDRPLEDILQEEQQAYAELVACLESLEEADLHEPARFTGMPENWKPWELIAENTYQHFQDHLPEAESLLKG